MNNESNFNEPNLENMYSSVIDYTLQDPSLTYDDFNQPLCIEAFKQSVLIAQPGLDVDLLIQMIKARLTDRENNV